MLLQFSIGFGVFPDAINRRGAIGWPDPVLREGQTYRHRMEHRFTY